jgi:hypothetical protein
MLVSIAYTFIETVDPEPAFAKLQRIWSWNDYLFIFCQPWFR